MDSNSDYLETLWDNLLSRDPERIRDAFKALTRGEKRAVLAHLKRMSSESDWHIEQRESARAALRALGEEMGAK
jgi:hypothetical protein